MANIAKNIRTLRTMQNLTQDQLAERLHVTRQTVSNYETGKSQPDIDTIIRLAEALQADPNTLIYGIPTPPARKREYVKTAIAVVLAILAVVLLRQEPRLREAAFDTFNPYLLFAYTSFFKRFAYLVLGFAVMQVLSLCFGLQPQAQKTVKLVLLVIVGFWLVMALALAIYFLWMNQMHIISVEATGGLSSNDYWDIFEVPILGKAMEWVVWDTVRASPLFLLPGALLWLFRLKKQKEAK